MNGRAATAPFPFPHLTIDGIIEQRALIGLKRRGHRLADDERDRLEYLTARRCPPLYDRPVPEGVA